MLGFLFGFNARLGRLHFFLATIAVAAVMSGICFLIAGYVFQRAARGTYVTSDLNTWPVIFAAVLFIWLTFTLQSMRFRDIGWDPVCVIPGWIALLLVDRLVAGKFPAISLGPEHHATMVGALVNFGLLLALTFWPGGAHQDSTPASREPFQRPDHPPRGRDAGSVTASRIARVASGEFGRRA